MFASQEKLFSQQLSVHLPEADSVHRDAPVPAWPRDWLCDWLPQMTSLETVVSVTEAPVWNPEAVPGDPE